MFKSPRKKMESCMSPSLHDLTRPAANETSQSCPPSICFLPTWTSRPHSHTLSPSFQTPALLSRAPFRLCPQVSDGRYRHRGRAGRAHHIDAEALARRDGHVAGDDGLPDVAAAAAAAAPRRCACRGRCQGRCQGREGGAQESVHVVSEPVDGDAGDRLWEVMIEYGTLGGDVVEPRRKPLCSH